MSHLSIDARSILHYLNDLGYTNITAEQLREFLKDLRKLIKHEEQLAKLENRQGYFENLFQRTTASYRAKVDKENAQSTAASPRKRSHLRPLGEQGQQSEVLETARIKSGKEFENLSREFQENLKLPPFGRTGAQTNVTLEMMAANGTTGKKTGAIPKTIRNSCKSPSAKSSKSDSIPANTGACSQNNASKKHSNNTSILIRRRPLVTRKPATNDPVALYQYYQNEWNYFRNQIPGQSSRSQIRWKVRQKLLDSE